MDKDLPGMKRVLRSTTAGKAKVSEQNVKRLKTKEKKRKEEKDGMKTTEYVSNERPASVKSAIKQGQTKKTSSDAGVQLIWSIIDKKEYTIQRQDESIGWITGIYLLDSGDIVMTDFYNKSLKKLDPVSNKIKLIEFPSVPVGMCSIGENMIVISLGEKILFADVTDDMQQTKSVDLEFYCKGLTCHDDKLYLVNENTVFTFSHDGILVRKLYKHKDDSGKAYFQTIVVSNDGRLIYIASWSVGLVTIDNKGNHLFTLFDQDIVAPLGLCLDKKGNVLMCLPWLDAVIQVSSDGKQRLGEVLGKSDIVPCPRSLYFDVKTNSLIVGCGGSNNLYILKLD